MPVAPVLLALVAWCLVAGSVSAQTTPGDLAADRFLQRETKLIHERFLDGAKSLKEWQERTPRLRREYLDMLGLWPLPERTPLRATVTGTLTRDSVVIEKLHYQSKPGLYVTANLYRPKTITGKLPAILYVCGHSGRGRDGNKTAFQDHGMWFARHGYICLIVDTLQLGEIAGKHHGTYMLNRWWWHSLGYTPAGVECWNGIRGIDYLVSRPEVDPARIGVTGISGGGATTVWVAAADERVKVAVPVSGMSDLPSYVGNRVVNGHCDCMFVVNLHRWEWTTLAALIAPRPLLFANSDNDPIFPMDGNRRIIARLRDLYTLHGKPGLVAEHISPGGHDYRPDLRIAIFRFFDEHLRGEKRSIKDADDAPLPGEQLRVFATDADLPRDALNASIDETFIPRGRVTLPEKPGFAAWHKKQLAHLRQGPFMHLGEVKPATRLPSSSGGEIEGGKWHAGFIVTEPEVRASIFSRVQHKPADTRTLVVLSEGEGPFQRYPDWAAQAAGTGEVHLLSPRGSTRPPGRARTHPTPSNARMRLPRQDRRSGARPRHSRHAEAARSHRQGRLAHRRPGPGRHPRRLRGTSRPGLHRGHRRRSADLAPRRPALPGDSAPSRHS
ncbi:MAG: prolyl oligopeptidase family serine peptidase [Gemmataceae bacterium]